MSGFSDWESFRNKLRKEGKEPAGAAILDSPPEVPASPNAQDIVDALVALGLITQAE